MFVNYTGTQSFKNMTSQWMTQKIWIHIIDLIGWFRTSSGLKLIMSVCSNYVYCNVFYKLSIISRVWLCNAAFTYETV